MRSFRMLCLVCWLFIPLFLQAQKIKEFSADPAKFPDELQIYMKSGLTDETQAILKNFTVLWTTDSTWSSDQKQEVIGAANLFIRRNARVQHMALFISSLVDFRTHPVLLPYYSGWEKGLESLLTARKLLLSGLENYLENTRNLFQSYMLYRSSATVWKVDSTSFKWLPDGNRILFDKTRLICCAMRDSIMIENTSGVYDPATQIWMGENGLVTWERAGYKRDSVSAELVKYQIDLTKTGYKADSVLFTHRQFFDHPVLGTLSDQVKFNSNQESAVYPEFDSYENMFQIKNLYDDIDYQGGLSMRGARLIGSGNNQQNAYLNVYRNDTLFMQVRSHYFAFRKTRITGQNVGIVVKLGKDSIFHSDMHFSYLSSTREISVTRSDDMSSQSPWYNSYHNIDMVFDQLYWQAGKPEILFTMNRGATIGNALFQSANFFNEQQYVSIQGVDPINPLVAVRNFVQYFMSDEFPAEDFSRYMRLSMVQTRKMLLRLSAMGFLYYNTESDIAKVKPKLYDYIQASVGRIDYDVMDLKSRTDAPTPNGSLNLKTFDLTIHGIPYIALSDSQNVIISPADGSVVMKRDRSFQFNGRVQAGLLTFYGSNFFFDYNQFKINLQQVDSLSIRVTTGEKDNFGFNKLTDIKNIIQNITGELQIDDPGNKSGVKSLPEYPIFRSRENSYVYYDKPDIQKGVYHRDKFFFQIYPFTIDSLDNFSRDDMKYNGKFVSAGIFPEMDQTLVVQPDYSLGFDIQAPPVGIPIYAGKGRFHDKANLSNKGLKGAGSVDYLTSTTWSQDFNFYPDSLITKADRFAIAKQTAGTSYPDVEGKSLFVRWLPKQDELLALHDKEKFTMYNPQTTLAGDLCLTPEKLTGKGLMDLTTAEMSSSLFAYHANDFHADTTDFNLKSLKTEGFTVLTKNVRADVDFSKREGILESNNDIAYTEFPDNRYISYIDKMVWHMDNHLVDLLSAKPYNPEQVPQPYKDAMDTADYTLTGARYVSVQKDQDSLSFISPKASYDYQENVIRATGVTFIRVADAMIHPFQGRLNVGRKADMFRFDSALVIAESKVRYHKIHTASVKINSRNDYKGSGWYDYIDANKSKETFLLSEIFVDTTVQTVAHGDIIESDHFTLSPDYAYQGKVLLFAREKHLTFQGAVMLNYSCDPLSRKWLYFNSAINPDSILIPVPSQPLDINRGNLYAGMMLNSDSIHVYSSFFMPRKNYKDEYVSTATGFLYFNKDSLTYLVGDIDKIKNPNLPGNMIALNRGKCRFYGEGKINLNIDLGQMTMDATGKVEHLLAENQSYLDVMIAFNFPFLDNALQLAAHDFDSLPGKTHVDLGSPRFRKYLGEFVGKDRAKQILDEITLYGTIRTVPPELMKTLVLNHLHLKWNNETNSYQSVGKIGIGNIMGTEINKYVEGYVEIFKKRTGDICDIFLKADDQTWYYFGYTREVMQAISSHKEFNTMLRSLSPEKRTSKPAKGQTGYIYMVASDTKISQFMRRYRQMQEEQEPASDGEQNQGQ